MALITCEQCGSAVSASEIACPRCGNQVKPMVDVPQTPHRAWRGFEWRTEAEILGWPLIHVAVGRNKQTGRFLVAKGIIAVGQFGIGLITFAQFGIGLLFAFGQFMAGFIAIGQLAVGIYFGLGQLATGATAIGQIAIGEYVLAQIGFGKYVWSTKIKDPEAMEYFKALWDSIRQLAGR